MEPFDYIKSMVLNFRLYNCCWCAPVRIGLILTGYFNGIVASICVIGTANETMTTTLMQVQTTIMEDYVTKSVVMLAYITEVGFSVLCLCGIYRKDLVLLRAYMFYCISALVLSVLVYSIVILAIDVIIQITIITGILFQLYVLILVRSAIVEIKWENKQSELPTLVLSSLIHEKEPLKDQISIRSQESKEKNEHEKQEMEEVAIDTHEVKSDVEKGPETSTDETERKNGHKKEEIKLETVKEEVSP